MIDFSHLPKFRNDKKLMDRIFELLPQWQQAYPSINLASELQWAHVWLLSNSRQRYTDMARFLNHWFKSAEKRARSQGIHRMEFKPYKEDRPDPKDQLTYEDIQSMKGTR